MKRILVAMFVLICHSAFSQANNEAQVFNDTSVFFINQNDSLHYIDLSPSELNEIDEYLIKAVNEFNLWQQRYADSVNPTKRKNRARANHIDVKRYYFMLVPRINKENQKEIWLDGQCKDHFVIRKRKEAVADKNWKTKFIQSGMFSDGGSCYIHLLINLTQKKYNPLMVNGEG